MPERIALATLAAWLAAALAAAPRTAAASDWPQFRGPDRHGIGDPAELAGSWEAAPPRELWRHGIGAGFSGIAVAGGRAYTLAAEGADELLICFDPETGERLWTQVVGPTDPAQFPEGGPRATPTVDGELVFAASSTGRLAAFRAADGRPVWSRDLAEVGPPPRFGYSVSPLVEGGLVLVENGEAAEAGGVAALDRRNGRVRWTALEGAAGYSSPIVAEIGGVRQIVFFRRAGAEVVGLSTAGEVLWRHTTPGLAIIVSPLFLPPDRIFVATSDDAMGGWMLRISRGEDGFEVEEVWRQRLMRNHFNTAVEVDGTLYGFDNATFRAVDAASGELRWARRGLGKGSLIAAGELLFVLSDGGELVLVEASPEAYRERGRIRATRGRSWTAPSLAGGRLYLRDEDEIVAYDVSSGVERAAGAAAAGDEAGIEPGTAAAEPGEVRAPRAAEVPEPAAAATGDAAPPTAPTELDTILARYARARGGLERWREVEALQLTGTYAAFSESAPFTLLRRRGDHYRLEFTLLGDPAVRARDAFGTWGRHKLLMPQAARIEEGPYKTQLERESLFEPPLLGPLAKGVEVELLGESVVDGTPVVDLKLTLPGGGEEIWHLDAATGLEHRVDSQVFDFTQLLEPMEQRAYYGDFREVDGLVLPFRVDLEFGARLETMAVEAVVVDPPVERGAFSPPAPAGADEAAE